MLDAQGPPQLEPIGEGLDQVSGGQNTTKITTPLGSYKSNQSDYAACRSSVNQYCSSQPSNRTSFAGIDTGVNTAKASKCVVDNLATTCGFPK